MEKRLCPFCSKELSMEHKIIFCDYFCNTPDHFFTERIIDVKDEKGEFILDDNGRQVKELAKVKMSLRDHKGEKLYLKINYDEGTSQVWTKNAKTPRYTINSVLIPNYNDRQSIINKIKTYLLFA